MQTFDHALSIICSALRDGRSQQAYLHGAFGAGKSHFMALLDLILADHPAPWSRGELHALCGKNEWISKKKLLQIPIHMRGALDMESKTRAEVDLQHLLRGLGHAPRCQARRPHRAIRRASSTSATSDHGYNRGLQWERTCAEILKLRIARGGRSSAAEQPIAAGSGGDLLQFAAVLASSQNQVGKSGLSRSPTP